RLSVFPLRMPSLRERREDIPLLVDQFIRRFSHGRFSEANTIMTAETLEHLCGYGWPGNIRQLMNVIEFLMNIHEDRKLLRIEDLPEYLLTEEPAADHKFIHDLLGKDLVWILCKFQQHGGIGRRHLADLALREQPHLTEGVIRGLLNTGETLGLVKPGTGRNGSAITEKGRRIIVKWDNGTLNG
ncbi:MAG: hypothetical protein LLG93_05580, partial [Deltaproteobacteria bacterium]|nr:hypothetical protein [Deltaproteobacteria bacterium]